MRRLSWDTRHNTRQGLESEPDTFGVYAVDNKHSHVHVLALEGAAADEDADGTGDAEDAEGVEDAGGDPSEAKEEL